MKDYIKKFEVKNFKKFNSLSIDNIGSVNLITGDNNVGKTTLLECLLVDEDVDKNIEFLHKTLCSKNFHIHPKNVSTKNPIFPADNYFKFLKTNVNEPISFTWEDNKGTHSYSFQDCSLDELKDVDFEKRREDNYNIGNPKNWIKIYKNGIFSELQWMYFDDFRRDMKSGGYWPLIAFNAGYQEDINTYYVENIGMHEERSKGESFYVNQLEIRFKTLDYEEKQKFISTLSMFIADIEDTTIKNYYGRDILSIKTKTSKNYQPITFWGEGFNKFVRYLLEIIQCKGNRIMIDEIDTGIHWTKQIKFWNHIIQSCKANGVQLFATTHSSDCIKALVSAAEMNKEIQTEIRLIELEEFISKAGVNTHQATTYDYNTAKFKLDTETNIRGGNVWQ
jgi:AAA15 family ATPase/GTPase